MCSRYAETAAHIALLRQHPRARLSWLEAALAAAHRSKDHAREGAHLNNIGLAHADLGETRRAVEVDEQQLKVVQESGGRDGEAYALFKMAVALEQLGERGEALLRGEEALRVYAELGSPYAEHARKKLAEWCAKR